MMNIDIYTDGASKGNPGKAGYGWVIINNEWKKYKSFGVNYATNNQMELRAVIDSLKVVLVELQTSKEKISINIYSDSKYVCDAFNKNWIYKWIKEDFIKIKNPELWKELHHLMRIHISIVDFNFIWVRGHSGNEYNEEADSLAQMACGHEGIVMQGYNKI